MQERRVSKRTQELRASMELKFGLSPETVERAHAAVLTAIHDRLPRGVRVALLSWFPESWSLLEGSGGSRPARGLLELEGRVVDAGVPAAVAVDFVAEMVRFLGERCGTPLAEAMRRKVPELAEVDQIVSARAGVFEPH